MSKFVIIISKVGEVMRRFRLVGLFFLVMFIGFNRVLGATTGTVFVDDYLNVRRTIDGEVVSKFYNNDKVTVLDAIAGSTNSCSSWYKVSYGNFNSVGYACGEFISLLTGYASCVENDDPVNIWSDTNKSSKLAAVSCDNGMQILDRDISSNSKCSNNWYKVTNGKVTGYACSTYVYLQGENTEVVVNTSYNRPWTSPKKSIVGGASFIAENYISKGQHTSYLKKFNVNPDSYYTVYNHQYMANLQAPWSEAYSSYTSYLDNGLLDLPLNFVIPVYENMPEFTRLPGGDVDSSGQEEVKDTEFEALLDSEGFPESYKKKLRLLHEAYPNWTFNALKTGLDFNSAVTAEQKVSSISGNTAYYYINDSGSYVATEPGWYLATEEVVAYYLDPRNFLNVYRILQFESLAYSDNYTEEVVQTVINSTHMEGTSSLDNQKFASIFVEAGEEANVSPVYLASLARQETGVNGSITTTGDEFSYKGVSYYGLYNYYNIGAYSSEESPAKAGLVWASGGSQCVIVGNTCDGDLDDDVTDNGTSEDDEENKEEDNSTDSEEFETPIEPVVKELSYYLDKLGVKENNGSISGISLGTTASVLLGKREDATMVIKNAKGEVVSSNSKLGTGYTVSINNGKDTGIYTILLYGDVNGDGNVSASDYVLIKNHILKNSTLSGVYMSAADVNRSSGVSASDYVIIKNYILGKATISQV